MNLPHGWTDAYTIRFLFHQNQELNAKIASLEAAIARLDAEKQSKRGPKPTAKGISRNKRQVTQ